MLRPLRALILLSALNAALAGCVNVSLPSTTGKKASLVNYQAPAAPFREMADPSADRAWVSDNTGNTVSFISDCEGRIDPPLEQLQSEALNVLGKLKVQEEKMIPYNARQALMTVASGEVDGISVRMKVLTLKKNSCNYTLSYTAIEKNFDKETAAFDRFMEGFKAN